ncbi:HAMP domain-containing sensor histidine kinase [Catenulispora subtropica]|uniref:histidine kinase n=1 Tax=Catenulispora subtropica TaxID=450798 RepID=A0ABN2SCU7_9ACTN
MAIRLRPRTIRMRLTLLYTALFLLSGLLLLSLVLFLLFRQPILVTFEPDAPPVKLLPGLDPSRFVEPPPSIPRAVEVSPTWDTVRSAVAQSAVVLALMGAASAVLGWIVAGRVLSPLRTMTARTRRISEHNLHERLALSGPRDELTELSDTVDGLLARLESAFEAQRRFIANASHELRTPLAMMRTSVDVAVGKPGRPGEVDVLAGKLHEGLDAADRLLEGLLLLARAQNDGRAEADWVPVAFLAASALRARSAAVAEKRLTVEHTLGAGADPLMVWGNPTLLASLTENLVDNAIRHNEPDGFLRITVQPRGPYVPARLVVENGGPVLGRDRVALLGQPFQRLGADRTSRDGAGLGLSIVAAIAAAHRGRLLLYARPEGGLRAEVEL